MGKSSFFDLRSPGSWIKKTLHRDRLIFDAKSTISMDGYFEGICHTITDRLLPFSSNFSCLKMKKENTSVGYPLKQFTLVNSDSRVVI